MPKKKKGAKLGRTQRGNEQKQGTASKVKAQARDQRAAGFGFSGG